MSNEKALGLFYDQECTRPIKKMDFGRLTLGEKYEFTWYMRNASKKWYLQNIELSESFRTDEITIDHPELLLPEEVAKVELVFIPSIERDEPMYTKGLFQSDLWIG